MCVCVCVCVGSRLATQILVLTCDLPLDSERSVASVAGKP